MLLLRWANIGYTLETCIFRANETWVYVHNFSRKTIQKTIPKLCKKSCFWNTVNIISMVCSMTFLRSLLMTLFYRAIFNQLWIMTFNIPITKKDYKHEECYKKVMGVICRILSFIILGSSLLCIGGSQSYSSKNILTSLP